MTYLNRLTGFGGRAAAGTQLVVGIGQSLMVGHFLSQETGSDGGMRKFLQVMRQRMPNYNVNFINAANGGSYAAKTSSDSQELSSGSLTNPFTTVASSAIVTVTSASHGTRTGAKVNFTGGSAVGGITLSGDYTVVAKLSSSQFTIQHSAPAASSASGGGTVSYIYYNPEFWWDNINEAAGPMLLDAYAVIDAAVYPPTVFLWAQGEAESFTMPNPTTTAEHKRCVKAVFDALRSRYGTNNYFGFQGSPGRRTAFNRAPNYQSIRESYWDLVTNYAWMFKAGESYPEGIFAAGGNQVHPDDTGYVNTAERDAYAVLKKLGKISAGGDGPVFSSVAVVGSDIEFTFTHDAGTDFNASSYTPGGGLKSFFLILDAGAELGISSVTKTAVNKIKVTTSTPPAFALTIYGGWDAMLSLDTAKIPYDNASPAMPIRPFKTTVAGAAFNPASIADIVAWFDASDFATITKDGSNKVSQWDDKSGIGNHATASAGHEPTWQDNAVNGLDALYSAGGSSLGMVFNHTITDTDPFTVLSVIKGDTVAVDPTASSGFNVALAVSSIGTTSATYFALRQTRGDQSRITWFAAGVGNTLGLGNYPNQMQYTLGYDLTTAHAFYNSNFDSDLAKGAGPFTINATGSLFNEAPINSARAYIGHLCEVMIFKRYLTSVERQQIEFYLINKWGTA